MITGAPRNCLYVSRFLLLTNEKSFGQVLLMADTQVLTGRKDSTYEEAYRTVNLSLKEKRIGC